MDSPQPTETALNGDSKDYEMKQESVTEDQPALPVVDRKRPDYKLHYTLSGHTMSISSIKFSPNGKFLASGCESLSIYVLQTSSTHSLD